MVQAFRHHLDSQLDFLYESRLLIAVSGGLDSIVLAYLCQQLKLTMAIAHCNFNLRDDESDGDENFVKALADEWGVAFYVTHFETTAYARKHGCSIQMAARELRYAWFFELAKQHHFDYILTAHHADDNLETFLINLTRGTGLDGLTGIPEISGKLVRPLLPFSREALETYAAKQHLKWREDRSNASVKYLRNKLRHEVIPVLKQANPYLLQNFQTTISNLRNSRFLIDDAVAAMQKTVVEKVDGQVKLNIAQLKKSAHPGAYLYELLKEFHFTAWADVAHLLDAQSGKQVFSSTHRLVKDRDYLILTRLDIETHDAPILISRGDSRVETPFGVLNITPVIAISEISKTIIYVDGALLEFPLTIRKWQVGDLFYPLGMTGKKKLSKYFKDEKLSLIEKDGIWILESGEKVVWVIGKRADDRFKVTEHTERILKIELQ